MYVKKSYEYLLFDLDGTLTDPAIGITNSVMYSLDKFGISVSNRKELYPFIGPPLRDAFMNYCNFSESDVQLAIKYFREYFTDKGIFENTVYPGIESALKKLINGQKTLFVATSKPEPFAKKILIHFGLETYFYFIAGSTLDETRTAKNEVIEYAIDSAKLTDKSKIVMIGDRKHDIIGAKKCGIDSVGVLYGYGSEEELNEAEANYIIQKQEEIPETFI